MVDFLLVAKGAIGFLYLCMYVRMYICMYTYVCMCLSSIVIQPTDDAASLASQFASVDMTEAPPPGPTHDPVAQLMHCRKTVELEEEEALAQLMSELPPEDPLPPLYGIKPPGPEAVIYIQPGPLVSCVHVCVRVCVCVTCAYVYVSVVLYVLQTKN